MPKPLREGQISEDGFVGVVFFAVFVIFVASVAPNAQSFRSRIDVVQVTVTVSDAEGRLITGLTKDDFQIFEDGNRQDITQFTDARVPVSMGVLLDASDSMRGQPIVYAFTIPTRAPHPGIAMRFAVYLASPDGRRVLRGAKLDVLDRYTVVGSGAPPLQ